MSLQNRFWKPWMREASVLLLNAHSYHIYKHWYCDGKENKTETWSCPDFKYLSRFPNYPNVCYCVKTFLSIWLFIKYLLHIRACTYQTIYFIMQSDTNIYTQTWRDDLFWFHKFSQSAWYARSLQVCWGVTILVHVLVLCFFFQLCHHQISGKMKRSF